MAAHKPSAPPASAAKKAGAKTVKAQEAAALAAASEAAARKTPKSRPRLVRDGFTMPESDFALIAKLKSRALASRREAKKSELLRAGLHALAAMDSAALLAMLDALEPLKVGRPKKGH